MKGIPKKRGEDEARMCISRDTGKTSRVSNRGRFLVTRSGPRTKKTKSNEGRESQEVSRTVAISEMETLSSLGNFLDLVMLREAPSEDDDGQFVALYLD
jgi:hypothetical protein